MKRQEEKKKKQIKLNKMKYKNPRTQFQNPL